MPNISTEFLVNAPAPVQVCFWIGIGAGLALMSMVYKAVWGALGYFWKSAFEARGPREIPMLWRPPEPPAGPPPGMTRAVAEGDAKAVKDGRAARKRRKAEAAGT